MTRLASRAACKFGHPPREDLSDGTTGSGAIDVNVVAVFGASLDACNCGRGRSASTPTRDLISLEPNYLSFIKYFAR